MSALAPTLQAFLSEHPDYAELGATLWDMSGDRDDLVGIVIPHPSSSRKFRRVSGGR